MPRRGLMMTSVVAAVSLLVEAAPASTAESRALIATNYSAFVSAAYVPKEHKKMIDAPSIISKIASPPGCTTFDVSALELDDVYASGVGEPDENVLDYDGSGSEMMEQAKHQIARRAKRVIAPYRDNNVFPSNSGAYGYDRNRPLGVYPICPARAIIQQNHASPFAVGFGKHGSFVTFEDIVQKGAAHYANQAVRMLELLLIDTLGR